MPTIRQRIRKIPRPAALERDKRQKAVEAVFRLVYSSVALRQPQRNVIAQGSDEKRAQRAADERRQAHEADLRGGEAPSGLGDWLGEDEGAKGDLLGRFEHDSVAAG